MIPLIGGKRYLGKTMLSRITALLPLSSHVGFGGIIAGKLTVDSTGNANSGTATVEVYDPNGVLLVSLCAETAGTRFDL